MNTTPDTQPGPDPVPATAPLEPVPDDIFGPKPQPGDRKEPKSK